MKLRSGLFTNHTQPFIFVCPHLLSRYSTKSSIVHVLIPHLFPNFKHPSLLVIPPCIRSVSPSISSPSSTNSDRTPASGFPANLQNSIVASVCPLLSLTPPSLARSGNTCPGLRKDSFRLVFEARVRQVSARSWADIPVVIDGSEESMEMV